jgi:uncharacterized protein YndB with AHSA1/START domain
MRSTRSPEPARTGIELQRRFRVSPEKLFHAWTQPAALRQWWCPEGWTAGDIAIDLRVGGRYRIEMRRAGLGDPVTIAGEFLDVTPPQRLVYSWRWEGAFDGMPPTLVTVELTRAADETVLTLRHDNFVDLGLRQQHRTGWLAACNRLDRLLTPSAKLCERSTAS